MAIYNREDARSALPQLEKKVDGLYNYIQYAPQFHQCTNGAYTRCYRIGNLVALSFNINITTATSAYDYITDIPKAIGNFACCGVGASTTVRLFITPMGTLRSDGAPPTGWLNGSVVYIAKET